MGHTKVWNTIYIHTTRCSEKTSSGRFKRGSRHSGSKIQHATSSSTAASRSSTLCGCITSKSSCSHFAGAIECFREALDLQRGIMGHDHPKVIATLDNLGYSFSKHKSYNQALTCYKEMLNAQLSRTGSFTMECCDTLKKQILIYEKLKKLDGAYNATNKVLHSLGRRASNDPVLKEVTKLQLDLKEKRRKRTGAC